MTTNRGRAARAALLVVLLATAVSGCASPPTAPETFTQPPGCPAGIEVSSTSALEGALAAADPGDVIVLAPGTYSGTFVIDRSGTADAPIALCGSAESVLSGPSTDTGYTLHLDGASYWSIEGLSIEGGQKGVMLDRSSNNTLRGLQVGGTGDEAVHLRAGSSDNRLDGLTIRGTGLRTPEFGEGVYIGSAESNWCDISDCEPDRSDRNVLTGSTIGDTTAEAVDVKEGTTGGAVTGNALDGAGTTAADSLIDVKGSGWTVSGNTGAAPRDGAQVHVVTEGWGSGNTLGGNRFTVAADGYAVLLEGAARSAGNSVGCDNAASVDGVESTAFVSNVPCTGG